MDSVRPGRKARGFFSTPCLLDFSRGGGFGNSFFKIEAYGSGVGRFCLTKSHRFWEETHSIVVTVFAFKSVDFVSQEGVETGESLPPVSVCVFFS